MRRFIDNVGHQVVERHLLGEKSPFKAFAPDPIVKRLQKEGDLLRKIAGEDEKQVQEREKLEKDMAMLENAMVKAKDYGVL